MGKITRSLLATIISFLFIVVIVYLDYSHKRTEFEALKKEFELSSSFEQPKVQIDNYFFKYGWYPDSLTQADTMFNFQRHWNSLDDYRDSPYRFFVDPFTRKSYYYIPLMNSKTQKAEGYFLLSAGIDSKINNSHYDSQLKLYDSVYFDYFDLYFGKKDILVSKESIEDWIKASGREFSLKDLIERYDPSEKRVLPRNITFYGIVNEATGNSLSITDVDSNIKAVCHLASSHNGPRVIIGDTIRIKGIYSRVNFNTDTTFVVLNCVIL